MKPFILIFMSYPHESAMNRLALYCSHRNIENI